MQFVGNDIVAYKHIRCVNKWKDQHFVQKVLVGSEITAFDAQNNKHAFLWKLWSIKEAAYKLSCFLGNRDKFRAKEFEVVCNGLLLKDDDISNNIDYPINLVLGSGQIVTKVIYKDATFFAKTLLTHQYVHSMVSNSNDWESVICYGNVHNHFNKNDFSIEVRNFAKISLEKLNINTEGIQKDEDGIPLILINNKYNYISLSHDQQFVSFAMVN